MNKKTLYNYTFVFLLVIILIYLYKKYYAKSNTKEPFITKIKQVFRPHYRNANAYVTESLHSYKNGFNRYLRQSGIF
jgi:hypothetical protein